MAYKQEPCPLCGRDMTAIETHPGRGELYCGHCDLTIGGNDAKTPEELIALMDGSEHRQLKAENAKLRGFWTADNSWHVELPKVPESIRVTLPEEHERTWQFVDGATLRELEVSVEYLRNENIGWEDMYRDLAGRYNRLSDLALMLHGCALGMADCDMCRRSNDGYACEYIMRELGVEVD